MMSRQHYELLAAVIKESIEQADPADYQGIALVRANLTRALKGTNPRFDSERFRAACGSITDKLNAK